MNHMTRTLTAAVLFALSAPLQAGEVTEQIRAQGKAALDKVQTEIMVAPPARAPKTIYPVDEAIRVQGKATVAKLAAELGPAPRAVQPVAGTVRVAFGHHILSANGPTE